LRKLAPVTMSASPCASVGIAAQAADEHRIAARRRQRVGHVGDQHARRLALDFQGGGGRAPRDGPAT